MVRIPNLSTENTPTHVLFEEPDHTPEHLAQERYEQWRDGPWGGVPDELELIDVMPHIVGNTAEAEREALALWRAKGGPRPATPIVDALGRRQGCTPTAE